MPPSRLDFFALGFQTQNLSSFFWGCSPLISAVFHGDAAPGHRISSRISIIHSQDANLTTGGPQHCLSVKWANLLTSRRLKGTEVILMTVCVSRAPLLAGMRASGPPGLPWIPDYSTGTRSRLTAAVTKSIKTFINQSRYLENKLQDTAQQTVMLITAYSKNSVTLLGKLGISQLQDCKFSVCNHNLLQPLGD